MSIASEIEKTRQMGEQLLALLKSDRAKLEPRLEAGIIDGLMADLPMLSESISRAADARQARKAATQNQNEAARLLYEHMMTLRTALKLHKVDSAVLTRAGVGKRIDPKTVSTVLQGATMMLQAGEEYTDVFRKIGVLPEDMEHIRRLMTQLSTTDQQQEWTKQTAKEKTAARNAAHKRVKAAMGAIVAAAELAFWNTPDRLQMYRKLLPVTKTARRSATPSA